jgi:hypothetical protein
MEYRILLPGQNAKSMAYSHYQDIVYLFKVTTPLQVIKNNFTGQHIH